jgi:hypothetical protein
MSKSTTGMYITDLSITLPKNGSPSTLKRNQPNCAEAFASLSSRSDLREQGQRLAASEVLFRPRVVRFIWLGALQCQATFRIFFQFVEFFFNTV